MYQSIGMDEFNSDRKRQHPSPVPPHSFRRSHKKSGTQPFTPGKNAIAHRFVNTFRVGILVWQKTGNSLVDKLFALG